MINRDVQTRSSTSIIMLLNLSTTTCRSHPSGLACFVWLMLQSSFPPPEVPKGQTPITSCTVATAAQVQLQLWPFRDTAVGAAQQYHVLLVSIVELLIVVRN